MGMTNDANYHRPWTDEPRRDTDITGRAAFARTVAVRIDALEKGQPSTVFGLVGPWGSGKTTILNEIVDQLDTWEHVWFSPWSAGDVESITSEFVAALGESLPATSDARVKLAKYSRFGAPILKMIPVIGEGLASAATEAVSVLTQRPAWHSEFSELSDEIAKQNKRFLVIVDDVDRLDGDELGALLRVVRLLGRFNSVHYLMAYDQTTIDAILGSGGYTGGSSEFMEKIVQYPFEVPPAPKVVRRRWSRGVIDALTSTKEYASSAATEHEEELIRIFTMGLETPRAAERLREQMVSLSALIADAEVDVLDFAALTWLRIAHHSVWDHIRLNSEEYLTWPTDAPNQERAKRLEPLEAVIRHRNVKPVLDAVCYLFEPSGESAIGGGTRRGRIRSSRYFDRYFHIGLADDDVSERKTERALRSLIERGADNEDVEYLTAIIYGHDDDLSVLALDIARTQRVRSNEASRAVLGYLGGIRASLQQSQERNFRHLSAVDRWLGEEIRLALKMKVVAAEEMVTMFGYAPVFSSAYMAQKSHRYEESEVRELYSSVARLWISEIGAEPVRKSLARKELIVATSFCIWISDIEDHRGFLAQAVTGPQSLIDLAVAYVGHSEWHGGGVKYDLSFREEEFRFAVGEALIKPLITSLSRYSKYQKEPDYQASGHRSPDWTQAQRRHFAVRSLQSLHM